VFHLSNWPSALEMPTISAARGQRDHTRIHLNGSRADFDVSPSATVVKKLIEDGQGGTNRRVSLVDDFFTSTPSPTSIAMPRPVSLGTILLTSGGDI